MTIKTKQLDNIELEPPYIERYFDTHIDEIEGVELSQTDFHVLVIHYLYEVLRWLYRNQSVGVIMEINLYQTNNPEEMPRSPDVLAIDGYVQGEHPQSSYTINTPNFPAPRLIIEIASEKTAEMDFVDKFQSYQAAGVQEYFIFDPDDRHIWNRRRQREAGGTGRLIGWRLSAEGQFVRIPLENNRLWSVQAESWLAVESQWLRLYDLQEQRRLTEAEYAQALYSREQRRAKKERDRADQLQNQLEAERQRAEQERQQIEQLKAKLRELNINPDDLLK